MHSASRFKKDGVVEIAFASLKNSISIYGLKCIGLEAHRAEFGEARVGKGCIRYLKPEKVVQKAVERLLKTITTSDGNVC